MNKHTKWPVLYLAIILMASILTIVMHDAVYLWLLALLFFVDEK